MLIKLFFCFVSICYCSLIIDIEKACAFVSHHLTFWGPELTLWFKFTHQKLTLKTRACINRCLNHRWLFEVVQVPKCQVGFITLFPSATLCADYVLICRFWQFCVQRYYKKSECANKIYYILPFAGFCGRNFWGNVVAESEGTAFSWHMQEGGVFFGKIRQAWRIRETGVEAGKTNMWLFGTKICVIQKKVLNLQRIWEIVESRKTAGVPAQSRKLIH